MIRSGIGRAAALLAIAVVLPALFLSVSFLTAGTFHPAWGFGMEGIRRDTFPVFHDPKMLTVAAAEKTGAILPRDAVIGIAHGEEAKAYPVTVMGNHELGNDVIDGIPIAITW